MLYFQKTISSCLTGILVSFFVLFHTSEAAVFYVSTNGNDQNPGTINKPFKSWQKLTYILQSGDTGYIRGGIYFWNEDEKSIYCHFLNISGTPYHSTLISAYPGEHPVMDLSTIPVTISDPTVVVIENCRYLHLRGLRLTGLSQIRNGSGVSRGLELRNSSNNLIEQIEIDHLGGYGFIIGDNSNSNLILNCDAHHLADPYTQGGNWSNSNGFQCTGGVYATGNVFKGCRAWFISDDGFDLYGVNGDFKFIECWSFWNGFKPDTFIGVGDGDGFKLGPASPNYIYTEQSTRYLHRCIAAGNKASGFDQNNGDFGYIMTDNISQSNGFYGFMFDYIHPSRQQNFYRNTSLDDKFIRRGKETDGEDNSWNHPGKKIKKIKVQSLAGPRDKSGNLPAVVYQN